MMQMARMHATIHINDEVKNIDLDDEEDFQWNFSYKMIVMMNRWIFN